MPESLEDRLDNMAARLDELAARATRAVADLRVQCQSILDDVSAWKEHVDFSRVDAELARMDARDRLRQAEETFQRRISVAMQRVDNARTDSAASLHHLRVGMTSAARDVADAAGAAFGDRP